jgi:hypothetical protein
VRVPLTLLAVALAATAFASRAVTQSQPSGVTVRPTSWAEAQTATAHVADARPPSLLGAPAGVAERWRAWTEAERASIAARIAAGNVDTVVNLLLFGTSFTTQPRVTRAFVEELDRRWKAGDSSAALMLSTAYSQRARDLVTRAAAGHADARLRLVRETLTARGHDLSTDAGRDGASHDLLAEVARVRREAAALTAALAAGDAPDPAGRATLFRERGLASDTSVLTQFAVERALCRLRADGTLPARGVGRVLIVGPGLDVADKQEGLDLYPPQTLQPFTVADSLIRCGLAGAAGVTITTVDVNPRVNAHLRDIARLASPYPIVFARDARERWEETALEYWRRAGDRIGTATTMAAASAFPHIRARRVAIRPEILSRLRVLEANLVLDRLELDDSGRFDLVAATNVLIYYDRFRQALALDAIRAALRPGGVLVTNDDVSGSLAAAWRGSVPLPVAFSSREGDGERMFSYVRTRREGSR